MVNDTDALRAAELVKKYGNAEPYVDDNTGSVTMSTEGGAAILVDVVRQLDNAGLKLQDIVLRRPSLDDVFMKLTGHSAE